MKPEREIRSGERMRVRATGEAVVVVRPHGSGYVVVRADSGELRIVAAAASLERERARRVQRAEERRMGEAPAPDLGGEG